MIQLMLRCGVSVRLHFLLSSYTDGQTSPQVVLFVGTLVRSFLGVISLTGGPSCRWYLNPEVPEAGPLITSAGSMRQAIRWDQKVTSPGPVSAAEHKKISDIKFLNPFKTKKTEFLVTVTVKKISSSSWWYNSCHKCARTVKPHGDLYRFTDSGCGHIGSPVPSIVAGDETGDTNFIVFGKWAQRMIKKQVDTLIASNPRGFLPDDITRLLEKVYIWNVSFTENSKDSIEECFQVNALIGEVNDGNALPATPTGTQSSSLMLSQGAGGSMQTTPQKSAALPLTLPDATETSHASSATPAKRTLDIAGQPITPQSGRDTDLNEIVDVEHSADASNASAPKTQKSTAKKRTRSSPSKKTAKKLFKDQDAPGNGDDDTCADVAAEPSSSGDK